MAIKVVSIKATKNPKFSMVTFQNIDKLGLGKKNMMLHSEVAANEKITVAEGQEINDFTIISEEHSTPQYNKADGKPQTGLEVTRNGKKETVYFTSKLIEL